MTETGERTLREVYEKLLGISRGTTGTPQIGELILMTELCRLLDCSSDCVEKSARALEGRGLIVCAPSSGRIAVLALARIEDPRGLD